MKRIVSLLMIVLMLSVCALPALAADGVNVSVSTVTGKAGDEVTVTVTISEATFATFAASLDYDHAALTLVSMAGGAGCPPTFMSNGDKASNFGWVDTTVSGVLFTATFKINDGAAAGSYPVSVIVDNFTKADAVTELTPAVTAGSVTVEANEPVHTCDDGEWVTTDAAEHWKVCTDETCGKEIAGTRAAHSYGEYVANADSLTETATCVCGRTDTRDIEGKGDDSQPTPSTQPSTQPTTPVTPSDPTESPKTGNGALVAMSIAVLVLAAAAVVIVTSKKKA